MKKIMLISTFLASALAASTPAETAVAQPIAPEWVEIDAVTASGSGCPAGTVTALLSPDKLSLTLVFSDFDAKVDPTVIPGISNPNEFCNVAVLLDFPAGWSYSILTASYFGHVDLGPNTVGQQSSTYWFAGSLPPYPTFATTVPGSAFGQYNRTDTLGAAAAIWSPCGLKRYLNIKSDVSVSNALSPGSKAYMNLQIGDIAVQQTYGFTWRHC